MRVCFKFCMELNLTLGLYEGNMRRGKVRKEKEEREWEWEREREREREREWEWE